MLSTPPKQAVILGGSYGAGKTIFGFETTLPSPILKDGRIAYIMPDGSTQFKDDVDVKKLFRNAQGD